VTVVRRSVTLLLLVGCASSSSGPPAPAPVVSAPAAPTGAAEPIDLAAAQTALADFAAECAKEGARLWGRSLCGPIMLVDPPSRRIATNQPADGLTAVGSVFVGSLPPNEAIANTATEWHGTRWTMVMWPLDDDATERRRLLFHESFHRVQPELAIPLVNVLNAQLDTYDGRYWLFLEWNALERAFIDRSKSVLADALAFRAARRKKFPNTATTENSIELSEGLAEYSGFRGAEYTDQAMISAVAHRRRSEPSFVRSFAYVSGPLYGYLLDRDVPEWRKQVTKDTDLGALLAKGADVTPSKNADARADRYDGRALRVAEAKREADRQARLKQWKETLVDGPVLVIDQADVKSGSFDPREVHAIDDKRRVFEHRTLIGAFGTLEVNGAILEDEHHGYVSLAGMKPDASAATSWTLSLEAGWRVVPGRRKGDMVLVKSQ